MVSWALFQLKGLLYPLGTLNGILHYVMLVWGILLAFICCFSFQRLPSFLRAVLVLLIMYVVYGLQFIISGEQLYAANGLKILKTTYLLSSLDSLLPIFVFYYYSYRGSLNEKRIRCYFVLVFIISIITYFSFRSQLIETRQTNNITISDEAYNLVSLFPLLCFLKKPLAKYFLTIAIIVLVILSVKRGAILTCLFALLYFIYHDRKDGSSTNKNASLVLGIALTAFTIWFVSVQLSSNAHFLSRWEETIAGESNGRDYIFQAVLNGVFNNKTSLEQLVFGQGANRTVFYAGHYAHNDWLETLCNNGFLGVVILFNFFFQSYKLAVYFKKKSVSVYYNAAMLLFLIAIIKTLFSMSIQVLHISQCMLWGYLCFSMRQLEQEHINAI